MGRPSDFTQETADSICERIAEGESLRAICSVDDMPSKTSVFRWLNANESFRDQYARAKEVQAETLADEMAEIADDDSSDVKGDAVQRAKLKVETRKWIAAKLLPKKYGDRVQAEVSGKDGGPVEFVVKSILEEQ